MPWNNQKPRRLSCKGIDVCDDLRKPPLQRCEGKAIPNSDYCYEHIQQKARQDKLRKALKVGWPSILVGKAGRPKQRTRLERDKLLERAKSKEAEQGPPSKKEQPSPADLINDPEARRKVLYGK